jgi:hypothetical protein
LGDDDDPLTTAVEATMAKLELPAHLARRNLAIWRMWHEQRMTVAQITDAMRDELRARGVSPAGLRGAGVGYESIAKIVRGPRPE